MGGTRSFLGMSAVAALLGVLLLPAAAYPSAADSGEVGGGAPMAAGLRHF